MCAALAPLRRVNAYSELYAATATVAIAAAIAIAAAVAGTGTAVAHLERPAVVVGVQRAHLLKCAYRQRTRAGAGGRDPLAGGGRWSTLSSFWTGGGSASVFVFAATLAIAASAFLLAS